MSAPKVVVVHLRRPHMSEPGEMRTDPFWEYGSFGLTRCHSRNLMNPRRAEELNGVRLAFAQGGESGMRLVYCSPPIRIVLHGEICEATWQPTAMPFRYLAAPLIIGNDGKTDFPLLKNFLKATNRNGWQARFSSRFRSRRMPLEAKLSDELTRVYVEILRSAPPSALACRYVDALPCRPPKVDLERESTYSGLLSAARTRVTRKCKSKRINC